MTVPSLSDLPRTLSVSVWGLQGDPLPILTVVKGLITPFRILTTQFRALITPLITRGAPPCTCFCFRDHSTGRNPVLEMNTVASEGLVCCRKKQTCRR